ncbi:MAG: GNAT family N-acetyltransferase [Gemmatimonadaceae bacterium]
MSVRPAKPFDAPVIRELIDTYVPLGVLLPRSLDFVLMNIEHYLVAERDGEVVGCVHLEDYSPSLAEIRSLSVDSKHQGRRVGSELVTAAELLARRRQYTTVFAVSDRDQFFKAMGYEERHIPELDRERSEVSRFKGVYAKDV